MKITQAMIQQAYEYAKQAYLGRISNTEAIALIHDRVGIASAGDYVYNLKYMIAGDRYTRVFSTYATRYYIEQIRKDFGDDTFYAALDSNQKHVEYYNALGYGKRRAIERLLEEYK